MTKSTQPKESGADYRQQTTKHEEVPGVYKSVKQLLAEKLQKVVYRRQGGKTHSMTKAAVIAAQLVNRAMAGDRGPPWWLLEMLLDLPPPPGANTESGPFRLTAEQERLLDRIRKENLENYFDRHER
jgi:hypothetical protein